MKTESVTQEKTLYTCETCGERYKHRYEVKKCQVCKKDCCAECGVTEFSREYPSGDHTEGALVGAWIFRICEECFDKVNAITEPIEVQIRELEDKLDMVVESWVANEQ